MPRLTLRRTLAVASLATTALLAPGIAQADPPGLTRVFTDPFTNSTSQHATTVEPDTFAAGSTLVTVTQSGRFFDGGASDIGFARSINGGQTWSSGTLPGITPYPPGGGGSFPRVSDPSVAFDARHNVWLVSSIPIRSDTSVPAVFVSRSTNGAGTFGTPVTVATAPAGHSFDKNWTACDNHPASPFYGRCYTTFDDSSDADRLKVSTSTNGGLTWGPALNTGNAATGLGGQPVVRPNGTVIIPASNASESAIISFRSLDGGASWRSTVRVAPTLSHPEAGSLRSGPLPSAEVDTAGRVYDLERAGDAGRAVRREPHRQHQPGPDGRRLHLDLLGRHADGPQGLRRLRRRAGPHRKGVRRGHLRPDRWTQLQRDVHCQRRRCPRVARQRDAAPRQPQLTGLPTPLNQPRSSRRLGCMFHPATTACASRPYPRPCTPLDNGRLGSQSPVLRREHPALHGRRMS
jgi:hypothetical protein